MNILIIHGSPRKNGYTDNIAEITADKIIEKAPGSVVDNLYLAEENLPYCKGCLLCVKKGIEYCPHKNQTIPMKDKMVKADVIILASPVYIFHSTGQMKVFSDHFPSIFLSHRPEESMFHKTAVLVTSAAGAGVKSTLRDLKDMALFWGIPDIFSISLIARKENWKDRTEKAEQQIQKKADKVAKKVLKSQKKRRHHQGLRQWYWFKINRMVVSRFSPSPLDRPYWKEKGWLDGKKPWKC